LVAETADNVERRTLGMEIAKDDQLELSYRGLSNDLRDLGSVNDREPHRLQAVGIKHLESSIMTTHRCKR
jgi:hypothetical protein